MTEFFSSIAATARAVLDKLGGSVEYSEYFPRGCMHLAETKVSDADLRDLIISSGPAGLDLSRTDISDSGTGSIGEMTDLEYLSLYKTGVTDNGLAPLRELINLAWLELGTAPG